MKIRSGFVSNSSSSSYIIVGLMYGKEFHRILNELNIDPDGKKRNYEPPEGFNYGDYGQFKSKSDDLVLIDTEEGIEGLGIHAEKLLDDDLRVSEISEKLAEVLKERDIDVDPSVFNLHTGMSGW